MYDTITRRHIMSQAIKKSMVAVLAFVTEQGRMSKENLAKFTEEFCVAKGTTASTGPRELTILKDEEGNMIGRKCSCSGLWYDESYFSKGTTCTKLVDAAKSKLYNEGKKMEKDAQALLEEAKDLTDIMEKVAKYEEFDAALLAAKEYRIQPVAVTDEMRAGGFNSIGELAEAMGVEIQPEA
jgi:hypothetical protein